MRRPSLAGQEGFKACFGEVSEGSAALEGPRDGDELSSQHPEPGEPGSRELGGSRSS